jgi:hypothetical protein
MNNLTMIESFDSFTSKQKRELLKKQEIFNLMVSEHQLKISCFGEGVVYESSSDRDLVIDLIRNGVYETPQNSKSFYDSYYYKSKHPLMLTYYEEDELANMKLFKLEGYDIGFALKLKGGAISRNSCSS